MVRPSNGYWFIRDFVDRFGLPGHRTTQFGTDGDIPVPYRWDDNDHDNDDTEIAVPPIDGYVVRGGRGDGQLGRRRRNPCVRRLRRRRRPDGGVFRPSNGYWFVLGGLTTQFGATGDVPLSLPDAAQRFFFARL